MTVPNKLTVNERGRRKKGKKANPGILVILLLCLVVSLLVSVHKTNDLVEHHEQSLPEKTANVDAPIRSIGIEPLLNEEMFLKTLKSCLPQENNKCKTFVPEKTTTERVAIMAPPGDMTHVFFRLIEVVVARAERKKGNKIDLHLIPTTHIAPYGYGKTHGWTRIIRVAPQPLLLGVTNTLQSALIDGQSIRDLSLNDMKANLRQQIRYHCRLSHVAAHTSLWTLTLGDLANAMIDDLIDKIQAFLGLERINLLDEMQDMGQDDMPIPMDMGAYVDAMYTYGASMMTAAQSMAKDDILKVMDNVLMEEFRISKNLTAWPCESFWTVGEPGDRLTLSPIISRIARAASPNCTAPFTSCFVKRDRCEAKGDGKCK